MAVDYAIRSVMMILVLGILQVCAGISIIVVAVNMLKFQHESFALARWYLPVRRINTIKGGIFAAVVFTALSYLSAPIDPSFWGATVVTLVVGSLSYATARTGLLDGIPKWKSPKAPTQFFWLVLCISVSLVCMNIIIFVLSRAKNAPVDALTALIF